MQVENVDLLVTPFAKALCALPLNCESAHIFHRLALCSQTVEYRICSLEMGFCATCWYLLGHPT